MKKFLVLLLMLSLASVAFTATATVFDEVLIRDNLEVEESLTQTGTSTFTGDATFNGGVNAIRLSSVAANQQHTIVFGKTNLTDGWAIGQGAVVSNSFSIYDLGAGADILEIDTNGDATFAGLVTAPNLYTSNGIRIRSNNRIDSITASSFNIWTYYDEDLVLGTEETAALTIKGATRLVGIGTAAPLAQLDIRGAGNILLSDTSGNGTISAVTGAGSTLTLTANSGVLMGNSLTVAGRATVGRLNINGGVKVIKNLASDAISLADTQSPIIQLGSEAGVSDDCTTIANTSAGDIIYVTAYTGDVITLKDGTGNLHLAGDFEMSPLDFCTLINIDGTNLEELSRSDN